MSVGTDYGVGSSTQYQREQAEKDAANSGKVTHNDFLKLLTKQLTTQDPLNPMQDIDFTAQLAQLQALDEQVAMTKTMQSMRIDTQLQAGTNMMGKYISGTDTAGEAASGMVTRVVQNSDGVFVELANKQKVEINSVNNVWNDASSMITDMANAGGMIGAWVEAGYDEAMQPIKGIVHSVHAKDGEVYLQLYGGSVVPMSQVESMRAATEDEIFLYTYPDEVREKIEKARKIIGSSVSGKDADGNEVSGIVADAELKGTDAYLILFTGEKIKLEDASEAREPTADEALKAFNGKMVGGYAKDGSDLTGIVIGVEDLSDGLALVLDNGQRLYYDVLVSIAEAKDTDKARLHGTWAEGTGTDGEDAAGVITAKVEVDGKLAVKLHTGKVILCENITNNREATADEKAAADIGEDE